MCAVWGDSGWAFVWEYFFDTIKSVASSAPWMVGSTCIRNEAWPMRCGFFSPCSQRLVDRGRGVSWCDRRTNCGCRVVGAVGNHEMDYPGMEWLPSWSGFGTDSGGARLSLPAVNAASSTVG